MRYDEIVVGSDIDYRELIITPEMQRNCLEALEDGNPLYTTYDGDRSPIAHPVLVLNHAFPAEWIGSFPVHLEAKSRVQFLKPTRVGRVIIARSKVYKKYIRRGRPFVTVELQCIDQGGTEVLRCWATEAIGAAGGNVHQRADKVLNDVRTEGKRGYYCSAPKNITLSQMRKFSGHIDGGDNLHTNERKARVAGFPVPIAQGMMSYAYVLEMILQNFGSAWLHGGSLEVKYIRYVYANDTITAHGRLRNEETKGDHNNMILDVWCENQAGEKTAIGTATALV